jgi:hypothetical protein
VLKGDLSAVGILERVLENVSDALIRVNQLQTVMTSKGDKNLRIMTDEILFSLISCEEPLMTADYRLSCDKLRIAKTTRFVRTQAVF